MVARSCFLHWRLTGRIRSESGAELAEMICSLEDLVLLRRASLVPRD